MILKIETKIKTIIPLILVVLSIGCFKQSEIVTNKSQKERIREIISSNLKKFNEGRYSYSTDVISVDSCGPSGDCITWTDSMLLAVYVADCTEGTTDSCTFFGQMEITMCENIYGNIEVTFIEDVWGHWLDCVIDNVHVDDWDCEIEATYQQFIKNYMPIMLEEYDQPSCSQGESSIVSRYSKELCVYPCTFFNHDGFPMVRLAQCGESTACCVESTKWCIEDNGDYSSYKLDKVLIGECSIGEVPCSIILENPKFPPTRLTECTPRNCIRVESK